MAIFITVFITIVLFCIVFLLYCCIVVGNQSKTDEEREFENLEQSEYIKKPKAIKKQNKKNRYKDKNDKIIYL